MCDGPPWTTSALPRGDKASLETKRSLDREYKGLLWGDCSVGGAQPGGRLYKVCEVLP